MKITDPDVIKNGEKDLIEAVKGDLDLNAVKEILKKRMAAGVLSSKGGEIVVYNNEIAFRLDFDIQLSGSLMFDRQGNYIAESDETSAVEGIAEDIDDDGDEDLAEDGEITEEDTAEEDLDIGLPDYDLEDELDEEKEDHDEIDDLEELTDETDDLIQDDLVDDDISDILTESREFWEQKKDS